MSLVFVHFHDVCLFVCFLWSFSTVVIEGRGGTEGFEGFIIIMILGLVSDDSTSTVLYFPKEEDLFHWSDPLL